LAQAERFQDMMSFRRVLAARYLEWLEPLEDQLSLPVVPPSAVGVPWLQNIFLNDATLARRENAIDSLRALGVDSRPVFFPMHALPPYAEKGSFPVADDWSARGISLPLHTGLSLDDIDFVCQQLTTVLKER
jgi:perosamine synthetase